MPGGLDLGVENNKAEISKIKSFLEGPLGSGLGKIEENLQGVLSALTASNRADKRDTRKSHVAQTKAAKKGREDQLESKAADLGKGILEKATKPVKGLFEMFFDFIKNVLLGGALLFLINLISNTKKLLDPLFRVINGITGFLNWLISSIVNLLTMPFNWIIKGINVGVGFLIGGVNKALSLIPGVGESAIPELKIPEIPQMEGIIPKIPVADEKSPPVQGAEGGGTIINVQGAEEGGVVNNVNIQGAEGGSVVQQGLLGAAVAGGASAKLAGGARIGAQAGRMAAGATKVGSGAAKVGSGAAKVGSGAAKAGKTSGGIGGKIGKFGKEKLKEKAIDTVSGGGKKESSGSGSGTVSGGGGGSPSFGSVSSGAPTLAVAGGGNISKVNAKKISAKEGGPVTGGSGIKITGMGKDTQLLAAQPGESVMQVGARERQIESTGIDPLSFNVGPNANKPKMGTPILGASSGGMIQGLQGGGLVGGTAGNPPDPKNRKIFLHWNVGGHSGTDGPYHQLFMGNGQPRATGIDYGQDKGAHTGGHNHDSVGLGVAAMLEQAGAGELGYVDWPTTASLNALSNEAAGLANAWGWSSSDVDRNVQTHGEWERTYVKSGKSPDGKVHKWDLDMLKDGPVTHPGGHFTTKQINSKGGNSLRAMIKSAMGGSGRTNSLDHQTPEVGTGPAPSITPGPGSSPSIPGAPGSGQQNQWGNTTFIGGGHQQQQSQSSATAANQTVAPNFSSQDFNNAELIVIKSIYNLVG